MFHSVCSSMQIIVQQSSLTEKWASSCGKSSSGTTHDSLFKYVVYKQPLSLDRFYIHDVTSQEANGNFWDIIFRLHVDSVKFVLGIVAQPLTFSFLFETASNLKSAFVLVCLNRFQQIITCHTFQAPNEGVKVRYHFQVRNLMITLFFLLPLR